MGNNNERKDIPTLLKVLRKVRDSWIPMLNYFVREVSENIVICQKF